MSKEDPLPLGEEPVWQRLQPKQKLSLKQVISKTNQDLIETGCLDTKTNCDLVELDSAGQS